MVTQKLLAVSNNKKDGNKSTIKFVSSEENLINFDEKVVDSTKIWSKRMPHLGNRLLKSTISTKFSENDYSQLPIMNPEVLLKPEVSKKAKQETEMKLPKMERDPSSLPSQWSSIRFRHIGHRVEWETIKIN
jgi:hypothetical protein